MEKGETPSMTEAILEGVRAPNLYSDYVPDFSGTLGLFELYEICNRFDMILSFFFVAKLKNEIGENGLKTVVVFTRNIQNPQTGKEEKREYIVDLTSFGSKNEGSDVIYSRNVRDAMYRLREDWVEARYLDDTNNRVRKIASYLDRINLEMDRLAQL